MNLAESGEEGAAVARSEWEVKSLARSPGSFEGFGRVRSF